MPKIAFPNKCAKCGSEQLKSEELSMYGRHGMMGKGYRFIAIVCQECGYTEFFYREKSSWI